MRAVVQIYDATIGEFLEGKLPINTCAMGAGQDAIDFRDAFAGSVLYLSCAVLLAHIQVHPPGGAQLWFSRR